MEDEIGFESKDKVETSVQYLTHQNSYNPFKDAIEELVWDGEERLERFFIDAIGGADTNLTRSETRKWFYALMKRLYEPGCAFDAMLVTYDAEQGTGKSKHVENLIDCLGLNYGYSTSITCDNKDKDNVDKLNKTWIVGIDEMNDFLKKAPEQTKQFLAQRTDQARLSYAKRSEVYQRHCVFYGSSNVEYFLKDYTSGFERRFWIIDCHGERHDEKWWKENFPMEYYRQVLAEAKWFYDENPDFIYSTLSPEEAEELSDIQYKHKTLQNDELLIDKLLEIMDRPINGTPETYSDWISKLKFDNDCTTIAGDIFATYDNDNTKPMESIPTKWIKRYISEEIHRDLTTQYITALVKTKWKRTMATVNGITGSYYVRN
jgi:predicted P-loop ATPase